MAPTIYWAPAREDKKSLVVHAPNVFLEEVYQTFGPLPLTLTIDDLRILRGMANASFDAMAYEDLIAALERYGTITVTATQSRLM